MSTWEDARIKHISATKELESLIPNYGYSDESVAVISDEKLGDCLIEELRIAKAKLFDIISFLFQIQAEHIDSIFPKFRDELDLWSDRIKVRRFRWQELSVDFFEKVIRYDLTLIKGVQNINTMLDKLSKYILNYQRINSKIFPLDKIKQISAQIESQIKELKKTWEARTTIFEIHPKHVKEVYEKELKKILH